MNKHQEALDRLENFAYHGGEKGDNSKVIQELVDKVPYYEKLEAKATPMKPEMIPFNGFDADVASYLGCPKCDLAIVNVFSNREYKPNFCQHCGQRFDWSKDE